MRRELLPKLKQQRGKVERGEREKERQLWIIGQPGEQGSESEIGECQSIEGTEKEGEQAREALRSEPEKRGAHFARLLLSLNWRLN